MIRLSRAIPCLTALLLVIGCNSGGGEISAKSAAGSGETRTAVLPDASAGDSASGAGATVTAPKEAAYTIFCRDFTGPNHAAVAQQVKKQVEDVTADSPQVAKLKDLYVVSGASRSVLYHGFYTTFAAADDPAEAARAKRDRATLESLVDAAQNKIFPRTVFTPLSSPDPAAPPEWDLRNAKGYWTLLICTYNKPGEAKQAAVDSVREARRQGYEAYYLFEQSQAMVFVGAFPADAIRRQESDGNSGNFATDPSNPETLVVATTPLGEGWKNLRDEQGRPYRLVEMKVEIEDAKLRQLYGDLEYSVNGYTDGTPQRPGLVEIPKATGRPAELDEKPLDDAVSVDKNKVNPLLPRY